MTTVSAGYCPTDPAEHRLADPASHDLLGAAHHDRPAPAGPDALPPSDRSARPRLPWHGMRWSLPPRVAITAVLALALVGGGIALRSATSATGAPVDLSEPRATSSADAADPGRPAAADAASATDPTAATGQQDTSPDLVVHVVGQVAAPGIVRLPAGARVVDAIEAAGGALPTADLSTLNLAAEVVDGAQVRVPAPGEEVDLAQTGTADAGDGTGTSAGSGLVDINRADATRLQDLSGVGPVLAERIVADREANGPFSSVDDLQRVTGIGPAVLAGLHDQATA